MRRLNFLRSILGLVCFLSFVGLIFFGHAEKHESPKDKAVVLENRVLESKKIVDNPVVVEGSGDVKTVKVEENNVKQLEIAAEPTEVVTAKSSPEPQIVPVNMSSSGQNALVEQSQKVKVDISFDGSQVTIDVNDGASVLDAMQQAEVEGKLTFTTKQYDFGVLVESISGLKNGYDGKYWFYYVDGKLANKGVSEVKVKANTLIEWRFRSA